MDPVVGARLFLTGKTGKGKNRVRENGQEWVVLQVTGTVLFDNRGGPWLFVNPTSRTDTDKSRWIHSTDDKDFVVTKPLSV